MKISYLTLNGIRNNTKDLKNEIDAALAFAKSMNIDGLTDFNKMHRRRRKPKRLDENPDFTVVLNIYRYYAKETIAVLDAMLSVLRGKYEDVESLLKPFFDVLDPKITHYHLIDRWSN